MEKTCSSCSLTKDASLFSKNSRHKDGFCNKCKACYAKYYVQNKHHIDAKAREYKNTYPEKVKTSASNYYVSNKPKIQEYLAGYYEKNRDLYLVRSFVYRKENNHKIKSYLQSKKEHISARQKAYRVANALKIANSYKNWYVSNKDIVRINNHNRRAKVRAVGGKLSKGLGEKLFTMQNGKCACCKKNLNYGYHLDHIYPISKGGMNIDCNIQLLCKHCNLVKNAKHPIDFMREHGYLL